MKKLFCLCWVLINWSVTAQNNLKNGVALQGYDPVAYFEEGKAILGLKEFSATLNQATYYFYSEANKEKFLSNPTQYEPQYGGFCAYGMSKGYKAPVDPKAFTIVNNKLYLNYSLDVKTEWLKNREERIDKANTNWQQLSKN